MPGQSQTDIEEAKTSISFFPVSIPLCSYIEWLISWEEGDIYFLCKSRKIGGNCHILLYKLSPNLFSPRYFGGRYHVPDNDAILKHTTAHIDMILKPHVADKSYNWEYYVDEILES